MNATIPSGALPLLGQWAARRGQPVTIFDLETTTNNPHVKWMGITELGMLTLNPNGEVEQVAALVDPERKIPPAVRELTGITNEDVRGKPTWHTWAPELHRRAQEHVMVGYNSSHFDCVVVAKQNARYRVDGTEFKYSLDAMALPGVSGRLSDAAAVHGISSAAFHRAMADVWVTAQLVEAVARAHGLDVLDGCIGKVVSSYGGESSPRQDREAGLLAFFEEHRQLPDLAAFGEEHGIKKSTAEGDVWRLIEAGGLPQAVLENPAVQAWLEPRLTDAARACWTGESEGRLKPLFEHFKPDAPEGFDYTQLKLAIHKWKGRQTPHQIATHVQR